MCLYAHLSSSYKTKRFEFLRLSRCQSPQTCAPLAFSPVPSRQQTPATATSKIRLRSNHHGDGAKESAVCTEAASQGEACLIDGRMPRCLPLGGGVQTPQRGKTAAAFAEGPRHGLVPLPDAALRASGHLK